MMHGKQACDIDYTEHFQAELERFEKKFDWLNDALEGFTDQLQHHGTPAGVAIGEHPDVFVYILKEGLVLGEPAFEVIYQFQTVEKGLNPVALLSLTSAANSAL